MSDIKNGFGELVGKTPLLNCQHFTKSKHLNANILAKLEYFNPAGSVKDRVGKVLIDDALEKGIINKETTLIEPTSGNTGIGLAAYATSLGMKIIITMPDTMSMERRNILKAYGAELVLTPGSEGMQGAIDRAEKLSKEINNSFVPGQFVNPANPLAHYKTTGPELWDQTDGNIDIFVASVGTGGTLTGTARYLKEKNPNIKVVAVEPATSPILSKGIAGPHKIQGIGAGFIPEILDTTLYDEVIAIDNDVPFSTAKAFAKTEGILVGISSGAVLEAASILAEKEENKGKNIVVILPDGGDRYYSTPLIQQ